MENKTLVVYFAQRGNDIKGHCPKIAAKAADCLLKKGIEAETFAITPAETYPEDFNEMEMAVKAELASHARPELTSKHSGMKLVKDIVLVVPNWWNALPPDCQPRRRRRQGHRMRAQEAAAQNTGDASGGDFRQRHRRLRRKGSPRHRRASHQ